MQCFSHEDGYPAPRTKCKSSLTELSHLLSLNCNDNISVIPTAAAARTGWSAWTAASGAWWAALPAMVSDYAAYTHGQYQ